MYWGAPMLGAIIMSSSWSIPWSLCSVLPYLLWSSLFKVYFDMVDCWYAYHIWYEDCYSAFFCFPFTWNIFFILLNSVCMCLEVWSGFLVDSMYMGLVFFLSIQPVCLLIGVFNPLTFKVIIDTYVPIAIFLIVWGWFCRLPFFSYMSWLWVHLTFVVKMISWHLILLTLVCLKSFWFVHQFLMRSLLGTVILVVDFSLSVP